MPTMLFRFPGGRYHATPWGNHVNEGLVEWPPSPWRLLRAFIATAFTKLHAPDPLPPAHVLQRLIVALAEVLPTYRMPQALGTHTRHYMPLGVLDKGREKTTLVFDTCAVIKDSPLVIQWPANLDAECEKYLADILQNMGYLGRAESWVEGRLLAESESLPLDETWSVVPHEDGQAKGPGYEQVAVLAPETVGNYDKWLSAIQLAQSQTEKPLKWKGKIPAKESPYPVDIFECLTRDTGWLQKFGWSQPPGSRRVLYWRRSDSLVTSVPSVARTRPSDTPPVTAALLALASNTRNGEVLPMIYRALPQAEILHKTLVSLVANGGSADCPVLTGRDAEGPLQGHKHLHILPLCLDGKDRLDHFLLWAPMGIDAQAQRALLRLQRTWSKGNDKAIFVTLAGTGDLRSMRSVLSQGADILGPSRVWISLTPFVPPRHIKKSGRNTPEGQVLAELDSRGFPQARVERLSHQEFLDRKLYRFVRVRRSAGKTPVVDFALGFRLVFSTPVSGPLVLGYASHFGLGLFKAAV